jgi:hypothetical protein
MSKCKWKRVCDGHIPEHGDKAVIYDDKGDYLLGVYKDVEDKYYSRKGYFATNDGGRFIKEQVICWKPREEAPEAYKQEDKDICYECDGKGKVKLKRGQKSKMHSWTSECNYCNGTGVED